MKNAAMPSYAAHRWKALGSYVSLVVADADKLPAAQAACERILAQIDITCSRFRDDSELVRANRNAGSWVRVDPLLIRAISEAVRVAEATNGLVDPTLGSQLIALGYDRDLEEVQRNSIGAAASTDPAGLGLGLSAGSGLAPAVDLGTGRLRGGTPVVPDGWREIGIDPDGALRVPRGVILDLGATGKAFAADLIAATVPAQVGTDLIISLGGDVAVGTLPGLPITEDAGFTHHWQVAVAERPEDAVSAEAEIVILEEGGLATSSTLARRWQLGGAPVHHLLDPRTGLPIDPIWRTASVCAASCLDANAASTAAIVMGDEAPAWLWEHDLAARLVAADGRVMRIAGWPDPDAEQ